MTTKDPQPTTEGAATQPAEAGPARAANDSTIARRLMLLLALGAALIANVRIGVHLATSPALAARETNAVHVEHDKQAVHPQVASAAEETLAITKPLLEAATETAGIATALLSDEQGRRVAADPAKITSFTRLRGDLVVTLGAARDLHQNTEAELRRNAGGIDRPPHAPVARLAVLRQRADKLAQELKTQRRKLDALLALTSSPAEVTLAEAIARMQRQQQQAIFTALRRQEKYQDEMEQLKRECKQPYVMGVLKPFTTPSRLLDGETHAEPRHYSLRYLQSSGALQPTLYGKMRLVRCAVNTDLRPPAWTDLLTDDAVQPELWDENQSRRVQNAQTLLRRCGPALVELGLLEP